MAAGQQLRGEASLGGSFVSDNIEDYYLTPWDLGYGRFVKFDHDFIGREALEKMAEETARQEGDAGARRRGRDARDRSDVRQGDRAPSSSTGPSAVYAMHPFDRVTVDGETVGMSTWVGYSFNEGKMLTLAVLDAEHAEPGAEVTFVWGEEDGGTASRPSSLTCRPRCARSSARSPMSRSRARLTRRGAGARRACRGRICPARRLPA